MSDAERKLKELFSRARNKSAEGDYEGALEDYSEYIELEPKDTDAYNNRGEIYFELAEYQAALDDFKKANEIAPGEQYTRAALAITHHALGNVEQARQVWSTLVSEDSNFRNITWVKAELDWPPKLTEVAAEVIVAL
jgi:tetratricopeptide (TPR) repeat protein